MFISVSIQSNVLLKKGIGRPTMYKKGAPTKCQMFTKKRYADCRVDLGLKLPYLFVRIQQVH